MRSKIEKAKTIVMPITGGIGRNIFATAVIRNLKKAFSDKKIYVIAGYPDIFQGNPNCRVYGFTNCNHIFEDVIFQNPDSLLLEVEPYRHPEYLNGNMHIVQAWCDLLGIECDSIMPDLYLTSTEKNMAEAYMEELRIKYKKPIIILQHSGGKMPEFNNNKQENLANLAVMHRRSFTEKATQKIVDLLAKDGYMTLSIQSKKQFTPNGAEVVETNIRKLAALAPHASGVIAIDSFFQHACAALNVPALVAWMGTSPDRLGYSIHTNLRRKACITPECHRPNSYAFDVQANGQTWDCPFSDACREYTGEEIVNAFKEMKGEKYELDVKNFKVEEKPQIIECSNNSCK